MASIKKSLSSLVNTRKKKIVVVLLFILVFIYIVVYISTFFSWNSFDLSESALSGIFRRPHHIGDFLRFLLMVLSSLLSLSVLIAFPILFKEKLKDKLWLKWGLILTGVWLIQLLLVFPCFFSARGRIESVMCMVPAPQLFIGNFYLPVSIVLVFIAHFFVGAFIGLAIQTFRSKRGAKVERSRSRYISETENKTEIEQNSTKRTSSFSKLVSVFLKISVKKIIISILFLIFIMLAIGGWLAYNSSIPGEEFALSIYIMYSTLPLFCLLLTLPLYRKNSSKTFSFRKYFSITSIIISVVSFLLSFFIMTSIFLFDVPVSSLLSKKGSPFFLPISFAISSLLLLIESRRKPVDIFLVFLIMLIFVYIFYVSLTLSVGHVLYFILGLFPL